MSKLSRDVIRRERADAAFQVYWMMGATRSLAGLHELYGAMGVKRAISTLEKWSVEFEWQRRVLEANARDKERREKDYSQIVDQLNDRDAAIAQGMKGVIIGALNRYRRVMSEDARIRQKGLPEGQTATPEINMAITDLATLAKTAVGIERLARGQATSRIDVWVDIAGTVVQEFVLIFAAVNELVDRDEREAEFIRLSDDMMTRLYSEAAKKGIAMVASGRQDA